MIRTLIKPFLICSCFIFVLFLFLLLLVFFFVFVFFLLYKVVKIWLEKIVLQSTKGLNNQD